MYKNLCDVIFPENIWLSPKPNQIYKTTNDKVVFICKCGNEKQIVIKSVMAGYTKSCGCIRSQSSKRFNPKSSPISKKEWIDYVKTKNLELINIDELPEGWSRCASGIKFIFRCECGNIFERNRFGKIVENEKPRCGKCKLINKSSIIGKKFNKLTYLGGDDIPEIFHKGTSIKGLYKCECGNTKLIRTKEVLDGRQKSCGECQILLHNSLVGTWYGRVKILGTDKPIKRKDGKTERSFIIGCKCGNISIRQVGGFISKRNSSCGNCREQLVYARKINPYPKNEDIDSLIEWSKTQFIRILEKDKNGHIKCLCTLCESIFSPSKGDIKRGKTLSCGCVSGSLSKESLDIAYFIESLGITALYGKNEFQLDGNIKLDIYIPSHKIGIEYHGLKWHNDFTAKKESKKKKLCDEFGIKLMVIYSDEWFNKTEIIKNLIKQKLGLLDSFIKLRPSKCEIVIPTNDEIKNISNNFHYIGYRPAKYNVGLKYNNELIYLLSISNTTRQSKDDFELVRMVSNPKFRVHGAASYLLKYLISKYGLCGTISTFADIRLYSGEVYEKMGFKIQYICKPNYYWTDNSKRYMKSSMRLKPNEKNNGKSEFQLRTEQGYHRIWDIGKIKYTMTIY